MDLDFFCFPESLSPLSVIYQPLATILAEPDRGDPQRHREGIERRVGTGRRSTSSCLLQAPSFPCRAIGEPRYHTVTPSEGRG